VAAFVDPDIFAGASQRAMSEHLTAPLRAGALELPLAIDKTGAAKVDVTTREPLLLAWPQDMLEEEGLQLQATVTPDGGTALSVTLEFAAYTEAGAALPVYRPAVDPNSRLSDKFAVQLSLKRRKADGSLVNVAAGQIAARISLMVVEGLTGRMLYLLGAEKPRMRRAGRELAAQLRLSRARDHALDRHGADLGVARFTDALGVKNGEIVTSPQRESDDDYRRRLGLYRPFLMATRSRVLELLNGPGQDTDPNAGVLSELGVTDRFIVDETPNPMQVAIHLVASSGAAWAGKRNTLLQAVREVHLIWPLANAAASQVHAKRFLADEIRKQQNDLRKALGEACDFGKDAQKDPALAPMLGEALARAGAVRKALGVNKPLGVTRVQKSDGGSRYELGLGADIVALDSAELDDLGKAAKQVKLADVADPELRAVIARLDPKKATDDPDGDWLFGACGLRTVFRVTEDTLYVSHLPTLGLVIDAADSVPAGAALQLEARDEAPGDAATDAALAAALSSGLAAWPGTAPTVLSQAAAQTAWADAAPRPATDTVFQVFAAAGLPSAPDPRPVAQRLQRLPVELVRTLKLAPAQSAAILGAVGAAAVTAAAGDLAKQAQALRDSGMASVLPLVSGNDVLLVVSVIGLPGAGLNLAGRRAVTFRWYQVPIQGSGGQLGARGSQNTFKPYDEGITAVVCVGYSRRAMVDPLEYSVDLPEKAMIGLSAYEFLMNLLDRAHPLGIQVNTYRVRHDHIALTGNTPKPLTPHVSKTYRRFQRRRQRGADGEQPGS
jgi:hypothetical protein